MLLILIVVIVLFFVLRPHERAGFGCRNNNSNHAVEILKQRYANGEIDDETYQRMLRVLNN